MHRTRRLNSACIAYTWVLLLTIPWLATAGGQPEADASEPVASSASIAERDARIQDLLAGVGIRTFEQSIRAVDFGTVTLNGRSMDLSDYEGSFVFLNFWATWCPPCREEMPSMESLSQELSSLPFAVLAVNVREERSSVASFVEEFGYTFPILLDPAGEVATSYGVRGLPTSYFISPEGRVLGMLVGTRYWDEPDVLSAMQEIALLASGE